MRRPPHWLVQVDDEEVGSRGGPKVPQGHSTSRVMARTTLPSDLGPLWAEHGRTVPAPFFTIRARTVGPAVHPSPQLPADVVLLGSWRPNAQVG